MKKVYILILSVCLLCLASFISAQSLTAPEGVSGDLSQILTNIANGVGGVITGLATIMFLVAGILYATSAGNPQRIETAKKALIYAIVGIVIGLSATIIVNQVKDLM